MKQLYFKTSQEWRKWLSENHDKETEVWLVFFKKGTGNPSIEYESAVEEALCFGWIDSIIKKVDDSQYVRKFTPRKANSKWSESNKRRVAKLIKNQRMTDIGLIKIEAAKKNGLWDKPDRTQINFELPEEFKKALYGNSTAKEYFEQLAPSYRKQFIGWIAVAKQPETKEKRINESVKLLEKRQKLGLR